MKKTAAILLALLCAMGSFVACGDKEEESETPTPSGNDTQTQETQPEETAKPSPNWDAVDKTSLGGITFDILGTEYTGSNTYSVLDFEDYTSDILDKAVFDRNRLIEQTLDCTLNYMVGEGGDANKSSTIQAVDAGDGSIDLLYNTITPTGQLLTNGYLMPFDMVDTIDITQPWWDQSLIRDLTILDHLYFGMMDFGLTHYDNLNCLFYNGKILSDYNLEDPYDLHKNNQWTMAKMLELVQGAADDLNGDGLMDLEVDQYGLVGTQAERMPMIHSSGLRIISWDADQETFILNMGDELYLNVLEGIVDFYGSNAANYAYKKENKTSREIFAAGRALFYGSQISEFKTLRSVEDNYGLIGYPAYDLTLPNRANITFTPNCLALPISIGDDNSDGMGDYSELGLFLQATGAYTHDFVVDIYIEKSVIGKGLRDEKSVEIYREMMQNRSTCIVAAFQDYGFNTVYNLQTDVDTNFASGINGFQKKFDAYAKRLVTTVAEQVAKIEEAMQ